MAIEQWVVNRINSLRQERGWSVYRLSQEMGINAQTIHNWFDRGSSPSLKYVKEACNAFGITMSEFFAEQNLIEATDKTKRLYDAWCSLTPSQQNSIEIIINNYTEKN